MYWLFYRVIRKLLYNFQKVSWSANMLFHVNRVLKNISGGNFNLLLNCSLIKSLLIRTAPLAKFYILSSWHFAD